MRAEISKTLDAHKLLTLYMESGWLSAEQGEGKELVQKIILNTFAFVALWEGDEIIGMGRAISDGVSDAYIQDVYILKKYRGKGYGKEVIRNLVAHLKTFGISWIALVGEPGTQQFYEPLGFEPMKNYIPMKLK